MNEQTLYHPWILFGAVFGATLVISLVTRAILARILGRAAAKSKTRMDDIVLLAVRGPSYVWCVLLSLVLAFSVLQTDIRQIGILYKLMLVVLIMSVTTATVRISRGIIRHYAHEAEERLPITSLGQTAASAFLIGTAALIILNILGISIFPILTALGLGGLAVALGLQDTLSNIFAGIHILLSRSVSPGQYIRLQSGEEGTVRDITWRQTKMETLSGNLILVPNAKLSQTIVTNFHLPDPSLTVPVKLMAGYETSPAMVERVVLDEYRKAAPNLTGLAPGRDPVLRLSPGFGDNALEFTLWCPVREFSEQFAVQHHLRKCIYERFKAEGIRIPVPQREVLLRQNEG